MTRLPSLLVLPIALAAAAFVRAGEVPDPLAMANGRKIESAEAWTRERRPELLETFRREVYGRAPVGKPEGMKCEVLETTKDAMDGKATRKMVRISYRGPGGEGAIALTVFIPNARTQPAPCFLFICNRGVENIDPTREKKSEFWPAEEIIARGYATATFFNGDVAPDTKDAWKHGAHAIFDPPQRAPDAWGTIAAWAWGASRCMDYLVSDPDIDAHHVAVIGHSRGGKTALWAGAEDERFAMAVSNCSGCTGAKLAHRGLGETVERINTVFPHWFCENYKHWNGKDAELPFDQHELIALIAPRLCSVASASEDKNADPEGEFLSCVHASPVYALFGLKGIAAQPFPQPNTALIDGAIAYHLREGKHDLNEWDWARHLDFADQHWGKPGTAK
jgi:hypothetical protein